MMLTGVHVKQYYFHEISGRNFKNFCATRTGHMGHIMPPAALLRRPNALFGV